MIDKETGFIKISEEVILKPNDTYGAIESLELGEKEDLTNYGNGYAWLTFKNVFIENQYFHMSLCFKNGLLHQIDFVMTPSKVGFRAAWDNWSEEVEIDEGLRLKKWLNEEIGGEGKFKWGEAWAGFDLKSGYSSIEIRYLE